MSDLEQENEKLKKQVDVWKKASVTKANQIKELKDKISDMEKNGGAAGEQPQHGNQEANDGLLNEIADLKDSLK